MKRFYKMVSIEKEGEQYTVHLDGRAMKTQGGKTLRCPNKRLAESVMAEWAAQEEDIVPDNMPVTQFLTTAIDTTQAQRESITKSVIAYLHTDLLCYRAEEPAAIGARQRETWDPWLSWFEEAFGVGLLTTTSLQALTQVPKAIDLVKVFLDSLDIYRFTILQIIVSESGSLVLTLAFVKGVASSEEVYKASVVEEDYRSEIYNEEKHGKAPHQERREAATRQALKAAKTFLTCFDD